MKPAGHSLNSSNLSTEVLLERIDSTVRSNKRISDWSIYGTTFSTRGHRVYGQTTKNSGY